MNDVKYIKHTPLQKDKVAQLVCIHAYKLVFKNLINLSMKYFGNNYNIFTVF